MNKRIKSACLVWMVTFLLLVPISGTARADAGIEGLIVEQEVDGLTVELVFAQKTLKPGETALVVRVHDAAGEPVEGLTVSLSAKLAEETDEHAEPSAHEEEAEDSHEAAEASEHEEMPQDGEHGDVYSIDLEPGHEGEYLGQIDFPTTGSWDIEITLAEPQGTKEVGFSVNVASNNAKWLILGSFLALNLGVVAIAAVLKSKPVKKS